MKAELLSGRIQTQKKAESMFNCCAISWGGRGLDGGVGGGEWVLVLCQQTVYFKLRSVVPAGEQG